MLFFSAYYKNTIQKPTFSLIIICATWLLTLASTSSANFDQRPIQKVALQNITFNDYDRITESGLKTEDVHFLLTMLLSGQAANIEYSTESTSDDTFNAAIFTTGEKGAVYLAVNTEDSARTHIFNDGTTLPLKSKGLSVAVQNLDFDIDLIGFGPQILLSGIQSSFYLSVPELKAYYQYTLSKEKLTLGDGTHDFRGILMLAGWESEHSRVENITGNTDQLIIDGEHTAVSVRFDASPKRIVTFEDASPIAIESVEKLIIQDRESKVSYQKNTQFIGTITLANGQLSLHNEVSTEEPKQDENITQSEAYPTPSPTPIENGKEESAVPSENTPHGQIITLTPDQIEPEKTPDINIDTNVVAQETGVALGNKDENDTQEKKTSSGGGAIGVLYLFALFIQFGRKRSVSRALHANK